MNKIKQVIIKSIVVKILTSCMCDVNKNILAF
jgi:hypothetical protein